jgi:hypothetical protein
VKASRIVIVGVAALAACGALQMTPPAIGASTAVAPDWTHQMPARHPPPQLGVPMVYDAATGTDVLVARARGEGALLTWTWDGTTWTRQADVGSPPALQNPAMAYDAATGTVVLYGGQHLSHPYTDTTWTWKGPGTHWTKQASATSPPALSHESMAYDPATGTVVLFGGASPSGEIVLGDTWTWNGTTWTQQEPVASPPARSEAAMASDPATGTVVLFGGQSNSGSLDDTWTWG